MIALWRISIEPCVRLLSNTRATEERLDQLLGHEAWKKPLGREAKGLTGKPEKKGVLRRSSYGIMVENP